MGLRKTTASSIAAAELISFTAVLKGAADLQNKKHLGEFLIDRIEKKPFLIRYFRAALDKTKDYGITSGKPMNIVEEEECDSNYILRDATATILLKRFAENKIPLKHRAQYWANLLDTLQMEQRLIANHILNQKLLWVPQLTVRLFNKVLNHLDKELIPEVEQKPTQKDPWAYQKVGTFMEITAVGNDYLAAAIKQDGKRIANISFIVNNKLKAFMEVLQKAGIKIECTRGQMPWVAPYVEKPDYTTPKA